MYLKGVKRTAVTLLAIGLLITVQNFTIAPSVILIAKAAAYALLFYLVLSNGLEEGIICAVLIVFYERFIGAVEGYMVPVHICADALTLTALYRMRGFTWYCVALIAFAIYAAAMVLVSSVAIVLVQEGTRLNEALRTAADSQLRPALSPAIGLLSTMLLHRLYAMRRAKKLIGASGRETDEIQK
jgi:uncharacterized membrane protein (DUF441 family)